MNAVEQAINEWLRDLIHRVVLEIQKEKKSFEDDWERRDFGEHCGL